MAGGVVLVAAAVALGAWAVDAAADTTRVYVLSKDVAPGADLTADGVLTAVEAPRRAPSAALPLRRPPPVKPTRPGRSRPVTAGPAEWPRDWSSPRSARSTRG